MPNTAQDSMPNNSQSDTCCDFPNYLRPWAAKTDSLAWTAEKLKEFGFAQILGVFALISSPEGSLVLRMGIRKILNSSLWRRTAGWTTRLVIGAATGFSNSFWKATVTRLDYC
jgi:hypothetical protein